MGERENNREMSLLGGFEITDTNLFSEGSRGSHLREEFLPGTSREKYPCPRQLPAGADRGTVGQAVEGTVTVPLQRWEEGPALLWCA